MATDATPLDRPRRRDVEEFSLPTQITSAVLVGGGTPRGWVLLCQAVAIIFWTTLATAAVWAALTFVVGVA